MLEEIDDAPSRLQLAAWAGDWERWERLAQQGLELFRANGVRQSEIMSLFEVASARFGRGDLEGAVEAWQLLLKTGNHPR